MPTLLNNFPSVLAVLPSAGTTVQDRKERLSILKSPPMSLLELPTEIRLLIFEYVFEPGTDKTARSYEVQQGPVTRAAACSKAYILPLRVVVVPCGTCCLTTPTTTSIEHSCLPLIEYGCARPHQLLAREGGPLSSALLYTSHAIYREFLPIFYRSIRFHVRTSRPGADRDVASDLVKRLLAPMSATARINIRCFSIIVETRYSTIQEASNLARTLVDWLPDLRNSEVVAYLERTGPISQQTPTIARHFLPLILLSAIHITVVKPTGQLNRCEDGRVACSMAYNKTATDAINFAMHDAQETKKARMRRRDADEIIGACWDSELWLEQSIYQRRHWHHEPQTWVDRASERIVEFRMADY